MENHQDFTTGKIYGPLIRFVLPVMGAMFLQAMYGAVDLMVVGIFGTPVDISTVGQIILCMVFFLWTHRKKADA